MEEIKVEVKIKVSDMYNFFIYHTYSRISGMLTIFFGLSMFALLAYTYKDIPKGQSMVYLMFALFFLLFSPIQLYLQAQKQVRSAPIFKEPIVYTFNEEGITTRQNAENATLKWEDVQKIVFSGRSIIIYVSKVRANIIPKSSIGADYEELVEMFRKNLEPSKLKIKVKNQSKESK